MTQDEDVKTVHVQDTNKDIRLEKKERDTKPTKASRCRSRI